MVTDIQEEPAASIFWVEEYIAYYPTWKTGSRFMGMSVTTYQTTWHHIPEHINVHYSTVRTSDITFVNGHVAIKL